MSSVTRPRGPLPQRVYWFRRLLVIGLALILVAGVAKVLGSGGDGKESPRARSVAGTPTDGPTDSTASRQPGGTTESRPRKPKTSSPPTKADRRTRPAPAEPSGPCAESDVVVTPEVEQAHAGQAVVVGLLVTTKVAEACTFQVSSRSVVVKLTSGDDRIWSSQDCPRFVPTVTVVARKTSAGRAELTWNGRRSNDGCTRTAEWALPGYYHVEAAALGSDATDVQFELGPAVAATITAKPEPRVRKPKRPNG